MNALPLKPRVALQDTLDELITSHGLRAVLLTVLGRLAKRSRPPDTGVGLPQLPKGKAPQLDLLSDHMRADLGLPPAPARRAYVDLYALWNRHL